MRSYLAIRYERRAPGKSAPRTFRKREPGISAARTYRITYRTRAWRFVVRDRCRYRNVSPPRAITLSLPFSSLATAPREPNARGRSPREIRRRIFKVAVASNRDRTLSRLSPPNNNRRWKCIFSTDDEM